jgi:hypothetical protein
MFMSAAILLSCGSKPKPTTTPYVPLAQVEQTFGTLITVGNEPTADQHGTGERVGIFKDAANTLWGLPLRLTPEGSIFACAPVALRDAQITDTLPGSAASVLGATNTPTGWRGGTGKLELVFRENDSRVIWYAVAGGKLQRGPVCSAPEETSPPPYLRYYRIVRSSAAGNTH